MTLWRRNQILLSNVLYLFSLSAFGPDLWTPALSGFHFLGEMSQGHSELSILGILAP
jgi:hypothetical protein